MLSRTKLADCDKSILSSYYPKSGKKEGRKTLLPLVKTGGGMFAPDAASALLELDAAVADRGGDFRVSDGFRDVDVQAAARAKYLAWLDAKKPPRGSAKFDPKTMKDAFVAIPGRSFHNAGRAIDIDVEALNFPGVARDKQLDVFWELAVPLGWDPAIAAPAEGDAESWHFDFMGEWEPVRDRLGYEAAALAACLDAGFGEGLISRPRERLVQAQLHRAGYDIGDIDGEFGASTFAALELAKVKDDARILESTFALKSSATTIARFRKGKRVL